MGTKESFKSIRSGSLCMYYNIIVLVLEETRQNGSDKFWILLPCGTSDIVSKDALIINQL